LPHDRRGGFEPDADAPCARRQKRTRRQCAARQLRRL